MTLTSLIQPMNFIVIKDFINQLLIDELAAQKVIAAAAPYNLTDEQIKQQIDFKVYKDTFSVVDAENLPALAINVDGAEIPADGSYPSVGKYKENIILKIGCFAVGVATEADTGDSIPAYTADQNAGMRLNYLISQALGILCAAPNWKKASGILVEVPTLSGFQRVEIPDLKNEAEIVLGTEITFRLRTTELFEASPTVPLNELYSTLQINESSVDPFMKIVYNV